jgi:hypothetical protein
VKKEGRFIAPKSFKPFIEKRKVIRKEEDNRYLMKFRLCTWYWTVQIKRDCHFWDEQEYAVASQQGARYIPFQRLKWSQSEGGLEGLELRQHWVQIAYAL